MPKQIACPNCGGPLQVESAFTTLLVCGYCSQTLYIHNTGVDLAGQVAKLSEYPSRLSVGAQGEALPCPTCMSTVKRGESTFRASYNL